MKTSDICLAVTATALLAGCSLNRAGDSETYTLYRDSQVQGISRIHIATFDSTGGEAYNQENCKISQDLFQGQSGISTKFWCEKGRFRK